MCLLFKMLLCLFIVYIVNLTPALCSVFQEDPLTVACSYGELTCDDTQCVSLDKTCDGYNDCIDGSDEQFCFGNSILSSPVNLERTKRQTGSCRSNQWPCRDGSCIGFDGKCDGIVDCPDGSDETHPLCRNIQCQSNWFRCTYGACVDGTAPCNGIKECADSSDELLPACRNETNDAKVEFKCEDGTVIPAAGHCDGALDCPDGSDETVRACAAKKCPNYLFQCAYGACVDQDSDCDGIQQCADGSDESDELCNRTTTATPKPLPTPAPTSQSIPNQRGRCVLPPYPERGTYTVGGKPYARPGQAFDTAFLNITCNPGFGVENDRDTVQCYEGVWSESMPKCIRFCRLYKQASVEYHCIISGNIQGTRLCGSLEPSGTRVKPVCRRNYYNPDILNYMTCDDGNWDYIAICKPGGKVNITIGVNDTVKVYITSNNYDIPDIKIDSDKHSSVTVDSDANFNLKVVPNDKGYNINILTKNNNSQNIPIHVYSISDSMVSYNNATKFPTGSIDYITKSPPGSTTKPTGTINSTKSSGTGSGSDKKVDIKTSTENPSAYDLDEVHWRLGQVKPVKPNEELTSRDYDAIINRIFFLD